jgi:hypothetical protein
MRTICTILNIVLLAIMGYSLAEDGLPKKDAVLMVSLLFLAPLSTLYVLRLNGAYDWLSLYLQRKALEERIRIDDMKAKK